MANPITNSRTALQPNSMMSLKEQEEKINSLKMLEYDKLLQTVQIQVWLTFIASFFMSPWSAQFFIFFAALVGVEIISYCWKCYHKDDYDIKLRLAVIIASISGYLLGRLFLKVLYYVF
jgi:uncharacterized membrane protein YjjP (DUF1212 family)